MQAHQGQVHTITFDNGLEFACHEQIAAGLGADIYFARPYCSWERGTNENTNGLIRQYFPKGTDFSAVTDEQVAFVMGRLSDRPPCQPGWKITAGIIFRAATGFARCLTDCTYYLKPRDIILIIFLTNSEDGSIPMVATNRETMRVGCYEFKLRFSEASILPAYKGSCFHGALGQALAKISGRFRDSLYNPSPSAHWTDRQQNRRRPIC